ncbi:MAG: hypothetical protein P8Y36_08765 [Alphaproteobacteria bacterium]
MADISIEAEGADAQGALDLAAAFFADEFGVKASPRASQEQAAAKGLDPAWIAVVLAVPPAIVAAMQLEERLKLIERTAAMLEAVRARLGGAAGVIRIGAAKTFDIATAKAREIIDALAEMDAGADDDGNKR